MTIFRKNMTLLLLYSVPILCLTGCVTDDLANKQDVYMVRTQVNEQVIHMEDRLNALEGRTDAIEKRQEDIKERILWLEDKINNKMFGYHVVLEEVIKENQKIAEKINSLQKEKYDLGLYHTVERGDILSKIAVKYGVSVDAIIEANEIENPDRLKVGQKLFIPQ